MEYTPTGICEVYSRQGSRFFPKPNVEERLSLCKPKKGEKKMITLNCIIAVGIGMIVEHFTGIFGKIFGFITGMISK